MKVVNQLVALLSVGVLLPVGAPSSTVEQTYLESCLKDPAVPVPVTVVSPTVGPEFSGGRVQLEFVVGVDGKPSEFRVTFATSEVLATEVVNAVKQWRFQPAVIDGRPVAKKVMLPVNIVVASGSSDRFAAF